MSRLRKFNKRIAESSEEQLINMATGIAADNLQEDIALCEDFDWENNPERLAGFEVGFVRGIYCMLEIIKGGMVSEALEN